jgi:hypothetical protein
MINLRVLIPDIWINLLFFSFVFFMKALLFPRADLETATTHGSHTPSTVAGTAASHANAVTIDLGTLLGGLTHQQQGQHHCPVSIEQQQSQRACL